MPNGSRLLHLKQDEKIMLGAALLVGAFVPWLLGVAGVGLLGWVAWEEFVKKS